LLRKKKDLPEGLKREAELTSGRIGLQLGRLRKTSFDASKIIGVRVRGHLQKILKKVKKENLCGKKGAGQGVPKSGPKPTIPIGLSIGSRTEIKFKPEKVEKRAGQANDDVRCQVSIVNQIAWFEGSEELFKKTTS